MPTVDVYSLREKFNNQGILLCFNGPFTAPLIEEIGTALRQHLHALEASPSAIADVFAVYIEMTQNIRHYTVERGLTEQAAISTLVVSRSTDHHYILSSGNIVTLTDGQALVTRIHALAGMDKTALKAAFKAQLHRPRDTLESSGAGLGLIDIARKATEPLQAFMRPVDDDYGFFHLHVVL